jgi:hypothetical protein
VRDDDGIRRRGGHQSGVDPFEHDIARAEFEGKDQPLLTVSLERMQVLLAEPGSSMPRKPGIF